MTRRETVRNDLRANLTLLLAQQADALRTGPIDHKDARRFVYYGLLLRCLPHYTNDELIDIQRYVA